MQDLTVALAQNIALMSSGNQFSFDVLSDDCSRLIIRRDYGKGCDLTVYGPCELSVLCAAFDLFKLSAAGAWRVYNVLRNDEGVPTLWDHSQLGDARLAEIVPLGV